MAGEWFTWEEAAARLGIKPESVQRRARARRWPRVRGNDGRARVQIPPDAIPDSPPDIREELPPAAPSDTPETLARLAVAEARLADALALAADLRADRDHWRQQAERLAERPGPFSRWFRRQPTISR